MEVILLESIGKLGGAGDTVNVKNGYARNFLLPQGKVLRATNENKKVFESRRAEIEKENQAKIDAAQKEAKKIEGKFIVIIRQAGEDGRLFGSVNSRDVTEIIKDLGIEVQRNQISLNNPIKYLGVYTESVNLYGNVFAKINVNVARSEEEAKIAQDEFLNPPKKEEKPKTKEEGEKKKKKAEATEEQAEEKSEAKEEKK